MTRIIKNWSRIVIGILLLLNALPFSGGRHIQPVPGMLYIIAGWVVLSWPVLAESFFGTSEDDKKFNFLDLVKAMVSACMFFAMLFARNSTQGILPIILFAVGLIILFIPSKALHNRPSYDEAALESLDTLRKSGAVSEAEYKEIKDKILTKSQK